MSIPLKKKKSLNVRFHSCFKICAYPYTISSFLFFNWSITITFWLTRDDQWCSLETFGSRSLIGKSSRAYSVTSAIFCPTEFNPVKDTPTSKVTVLNPYFVPFATYIEGVYVIWSYWSSFEYSITFPTW